MTQKVQRVIALLLLCAGLAALAAYLWHGRADGNAAAAPETVILATNTSYVGMCPIIAAQQQGYFLRAGIAAQIQNHNSGKSALEAALQGRAHLGTVADIPIMFAVLDKVPVSVVATFFRAERDHGIVGRRDRGVTGPGSLKGKRIGVTLGTSAHFVLNAVLNRQLLSARDVTLHNLKAEEFAGALQRGDVDAVSSWEPFLDGLATQLGSNATVFYAEDLYEIPYNIAGSREYVVSHPETIKKVLRAVVEGARYCREEPAAAQAMTAAVMKSTATKWRELWPSYRFSVGLDQALLLALEEEARWAMSNQLVATVPMPNYLGAIDLQPLKAVAPAAVTVIH
ncbi:NrtA/SsuA/CpmA family ABC transporter substrate-binding protein [Pseudoduganella namucuonensis]|uniref:NitT/TauT family transport system substrate-binding protein n=1 Tax=Pseudoduganella namucuonensis TaxID=1035707 RepID=A0A1I7F671_9BURK|nr:NrtA/SsuA/CpmA family ABC transporter substrate-binding protein [Pseudoduganella namucuonensis]SFU31701.1 NitT/TauT family transport system substrate-binding protein [Pseudoduganella namucuonensis]